MLSVLYVDDEPALLQVGKIFLERQGDLAVDTVPSATDAIAILNTRTYDCIVSDYQMPRMDGLEFLKYVRQKWCLLPFILFTGKGREEVVIEALNNGADFYLQKGGDPKSQFAELAHKIRVATERQITGEKLRDSEQRFSDIINFLPDPTFAIDREGKVIFWNRAIEKLTGVSRELVIGAGDYSYSYHVFGKREPLLLDLILKDEPGLKARYPDVIRESDRYIAERFIPSLNSVEGVHIWIIASPLYDSEGNITGAIESIRDITRKKKTEDELRAAFEQLAAAEEELRQQYRDLAHSEMIIRDNERRLADIINFLPDATFAIDKSGVVIAWNNAMEEITGVLRAEIIGTGDYSYSIPLWGERRPVLVDLVLTGDHEIAERYPNAFWKDGKLINEVFAPGLYRGKGAYVWFVASPLFDSGGTVVGAIESIRDVTDRKKAHDELMAAYEQLAATEEELRQQYRDLSWTEERIRKDERFIRDVFSSIQDGITVLDRDLTIVQVNDAMGSLVSELQSVIGKKCYEVYYHRTTPCDTCPALHTLKTGFPDHKVVTRNPGNDDPVQLDVYSYPLFDSGSGKITGIIEYIRGVSDLSKPA